MTDNKKIVNNSASRFSYYYARSILPILQIVNFIGNLLRSFIVFIGLAFLLHFGIIYAGRVFKRHFASSYDELVLFHAQMKDIALDKYPYLNELQRPTVDGIEIPIIVFFIAFLLVVILLKKALRILAKYAKYVELKITYNNLMRDPISGKAPEELKKLESTLKEVIDVDSNVNKKGREEMLELYREIRVNLENMKTDLTFLSIDVVDSTGMKKNEESVTIEVDFNQYNKLVEAAFKQHGYLKATWTPDGVMCCFPTADEAVSAAQEILDKIVDFNMHGKSIKRDFSIRCGTNSGKVPYDEDMPLERLCDHVIDVAGHFQKYGLIDQICISKNTYDRLSNPSSFCSADKDVDGIDMYIKHMD